MINLFLVLLSLVSFSHANNVKLEAGKVDTGYNYFQIPGTTGTRVDLPKSSGFSFYRLYATLNLSEKNVLRFLYAPFVKNYNFNPSANIDFNGSTFTSGTDTTASFKFNSYRVSYIHSFDPMGDFTFKLGLTAKVRDAFIQMKNNTTDSKKANVGLVPLLNLGFDWNLSENFKFNFDLDGAAAKQGRAFDGSFEAIYKFSDPISAGAGLRILEGGANNDVVENFALFKYYYASLYYHF